MLNQSITLTQYLIEERRRFPQASGSFNSVVLAVALPYWTLIGEPLTR